MLRRIFELVPAIHINISKRYYRLVPEMVKSTKEIKIERSLIQNSLGINYQQTSYIICKYKDIRTTENHRLEETLMTLNKMGYDRTDIVKHPQCLLILGKTIEHSTKYLQELGFSSISLNLILVFRKYLRKPIELLKSYSLIKENVNVPERLLSYLDPKPDNLICVKSFNENNTVIEIHREILRNYLKWRLETTEENIDRLFSCYVNFKYKSIQVICDLIYYLTNELGFDKTRILNNTYLFHETPSSIQNILKSVPTLVGLDIKVVVYRYPKIMTLNPKNLINIENQLRNFGIKDEWVQKHLDILTLNPETVKQRLEDLKVVPEFKVLRNNPRIVLLLVSQAKAKNRLKYLKNINVNNVSLHHLCSPTSVFEKILQESNKWSKGADTLNFLERELKTNASELRQKLYHNQHWYYVPVKHVEETLIFVKKLFRIKIIAKFPTILLYSIDKIKEARDESINLSQSLNVKLTDSQLINLCLYIIEKKYHFSGDGIWNADSIKIP